MTPQRLARVLGVVSAQLGVQALAFLSGIVLVRTMSPTQYGFYTLVITLIGAANVLTELGIANAVLSVGGRLMGQGVSLRGLLLDAHALQTLLAVAAPCLVLPPFAILLLHQHASWWQTIVLAAMGATCSFFNVRNVIAQSIARLCGHLAVQQKLDLATNAARLLLLAIASSALLDATTATALNVAVAAGAFVAWRAYLGRELGDGAALRGEQVAALRASVGRQAPNCIYYVLNGQLAVWLVGVFGSTERVADVGALGRLGAAFAIITSVIGALVLPFFARNQQAERLESGFAALNLFFLALVVVLVGASVLAPGPILWVLGPHYVGLRRELAWMVLSTSFVAWSGALYTVGCARGWVLPGTLGIAAGVLSTIAGLRCFDVSTVAGNFELNTLTAGVALAVNFGYTSLRLLRHRRDGGSLPGSAIA